MWLALFMIPSRVSSRNHCISKMPQAMVSIMSTETGGNVMIWLCSRWSRLNSERICLTSMQGWRHCQGFQLGEGLPDEKIWKVCGTCIMSWEGWKFNDCRCHLMKEIAVTFQFLVASLALGPGAKVSTEMYARTLWWTLACINCSPSTRVGQADRLCKTEVKGVHLHNEYMWNGPKCIICLVASWANQSWGTATPATHSKLRLVPLTNQEFVWLYLVIMT